MSQKFLVDKVFKAPSEGFRSRTDTPSFEQKIGDAQIKVIKFGVLNQTAFGTLHVSGTKGADQRVRDNFKIFPDGWGAYSAIGSDIAENGNFPIAEGGHFQKAVKRREISHKRFGGDLLLKIINPFSFRKKSSFSQIPLEARLSLTF